MDKLINKKAIWAVSRSISLATCMLLLTKTALAVDFEVRGNVSKGTCEVSYTSMEVRFDTPILIPQLKQDVNDKTYVKPFSLEYSCADFDLSGGPAPFKMKITAGTGTSVDPNNKLYPTHNVTGAAFVLESCDENKRNCKIVDLNAGGDIDFNVTANSKLENNFEVNIVQLGSNTPVPGELVASVDITLLQP